MIENTVVLEPCVRGAAMIKKTVLVVEDEEDIRELVSYHLLKEGYQVAGVASGEEALATAEAQPPDLILLDLMLPGIDGLTVCQRLRSNPRTESVPIMMLTAKSEEADIVRGLNLGPTTTSPSPSAPRCLLARVRAVFAACRRRRRGTGRRGRRRRRSHRDPRHGDSSRPARSAGRRRRSSLSSTEFRVLYFLASQPGWVFSRQQILDGVHGDNYAITDRAVDVQIVGLRKKLGTAGKYIETVRGVGYRFKE